MRKANISIGIAVWIVAMIAIAMMTSGCFEDAGDIAKDISEIGSKDYQETFIKGEKRQIAVDSEYALLIKRVHGRTAGHSGTTPKEAEVVIEIFSNNISIGQRTLTTGFGQEIEIERLTLELIRVDRSEEYASIRIREKIDVVGYGEKVGGTMKKVAEGAIESATSS